MVEAMAYYEVVKAVEEGKALEMCKYRSCGDWGSWKSVSGEIALHKLNVTVTALDEFDEEETYHPYAFRLAETV